MLVYWASPSGSGDGLTFDTPGSIATVKALARANRAADDITVYLRGGTYALAAALSFTSDDSGANGHRVVWQAYGIAPSILSGGVQITGWTLHDAPKNIWSASVPAGQNARQLYVNGVRVARASTTTRGFSSADGGATYASTDATLPTFARPQDLELVFTGAVNWIEDRVMVASATRVGSTTTLTMLEVGTRFTTTWSFANWPTQPTRVENAYELLSASTPGCWYLDPSTDTLYYVPKVGEDMATADVRLPVAEQIITGDAASPLSDVHFRGVFIEHAGWLAPSTQGCFLEVQANDHREPPNEWGDASVLYSNTMPPAAVSLPGAQRVSVACSVFQHLGGHGIYFGAGARDCSVEWNAFRDISGTAIRIGDTTSFAPASPTGSILVGSNLVDGVAVEYRGGVGIFLGIVDRVRVLHNEVCNLPYTAISMGWGWQATGYLLNVSRGNEIAWNNVHHIMQTLRDGGGIYTVGLQGATDRGQIHENYIYSVGTGGSDGNRQMLYTDDVTQYVDLWSNVCVGAGPYWFLENGLAQHNTASGNFASSGLSRFSNATNHLASIDEATFITGTDPAGWPSEASDIALASGPQGLAVGAGDLSLLGGAPAVTASGWIARGSGGFGVARWGPSSMDGRLRVKVFDPGLGRWRVVPLKRFR